MHNLIISALYPNIFSVQIYDTEPIKYHTQNTVFKECSVNYIWNQWFVYHYIIFILATG